MQAGAFYFVFCQYGHVQSMIPSQKALLNIAFCGKLHFFETVSDDCLSSEGIVFNTLFFLLQSFHRGWVLSLVQERQHGAHGCHNTPRIPNLTPAGCFSKNGFVLTLFKIYSAECLEQKKEYIFIWIEYTSQATFGSLRFITPILASGNMGDFAFSYHHMVLHSIKQEGLWLIIWYSVETCSVWKKLLWNSCSYGREKGWGKKNPLFSECSVIHNCEAISVSISSSLLTVWNLAIFLNK